MPIALQKYNVEHPSIPVSNLFWVDTFGERLEQFHELSDYIVILPGGFGTLHELMDFLVHKQFGLDNKPIVLLNINGFWNSLLDQFKKMNEQKLLSSAHFNALCVVDTVSDCLTLLDSNQSPTNQTLSDRYWQQ